MTSATIVTKSLAFPASAVEAALRSELVDSVKADAAVTGVVLPPSSTEIAQMAVRIDSLVAVTTLCAVEPIIGFELPNAVVRAGGYASVNAAIDDLLPQIEKKWVQRQGAKI